jgi:hypothetical protein
MLEVVNRRTDNSMANTKLPKRQSMVNYILHRKLTIEEHESY